MLAITVGRTGGPEVLVASEQPDPVAGPGELLVRVEAAGVNFIDAYQRSGLYAVDVPFRPGLEGAGRVVAAGRPGEGGGADAGGDGVRVGDLVAWCDVRGSYAELVVVPAARAVRVPAGVPAAVAAAAMLQGLTAHFLSHDTFPLAQGHRCLVHAAAGGVGRLLVQLAKRRGAEVFATVGSAEKAELARGAGADHVILYREEDFGDAVEAVAGPRALDVVYDGVGRSTFARGLDLLRPRGMMVTFGNASGPVDPVAPLTLMAKGSLYLTRPTLGHYVRGTAELRARAASLLGLVADGALDVRVGARVPLAEAARAHEVIEGRGTAGKVLLVP